MNNNIWRPTEFCKWSRLDKVRETKSHWSHDSTEHHPFECT
uniref:Uncharacterized protein n=1 Tax=Ciona intestinalis TaxID=7719 RepID=H2XW24_CIOIN